MKTRLLAALPLFCCLSVPPAMAADPAPFLDTARSAIERGHGADCSLEMVPVDRGGYYPCLDVDPYRIVFTYGGSKVFVVQKGRKPFPIFEGGRDTGTFIAAGPWQDDLPARLALWWADIAEGGAQRARQAAEQSGEKIAAEEYVNRLRGTPKDKPAAPMVRSQEAETPAATPAPASEITPDIREILTH